MVKKVGRGKYSDCYRGVCTFNGRECCIKVLKPVRMKKIKRKGITVVLIFREVKILQDLYGGPHIIPVVQDGCSYD